MSEPVFRPRTVAVLVAVVALSLASLALFFLLGDSLWGPPSAGADAFSGSAVGHRAFVDLLEALDVPVVVSRHESRERAGDSALLVVAEPDLGGGDDRRERLLDDMLARAGPLLLVLPKRLAVDDPDRPGWVREAPLDSPSRADALLARVRRDLHVARRPAESLAWGEGPLGAVPTFEGPVQVVTLGRGMDGVVAAGDEALVVHLEDRPSWGSDVWILTDPDVMAAHGLRRGDNALLLARLVNSLRPAGGAVVVDETLHGNEESPSLGRALFRWPLVLPVLSALGAALALVWAGFSRSRPPLPVAPAFGAGKRVLIDNTADLLRYGGHAAHALDRYRLFAVQEVARATHAPSSLDEAGTRAWLARVGEARRVRAALPDVEAAVEAARTSGDDRRVLEAATAVDDWRREMTDGTGRDP